MDIVNMAGLTDRCKALQRACATSRSETACMGEMYPDQNSSQSLRSLSPVASMVSGEAEDRIGLVYETTTLW